MLVWFGSVLLPVTVRKQLSQFLRKAFSNHHHPLALAIGCNRIDQSMVVLVVPSQTTDFSPSNEQAALIFARATHRWSQDTACRSVALMSRVLTGIAQAFQTDLDPSKP